MRAVEMVLPVIMVLLIGILLRKKNIVSREGINTLKTIAVNVTLPAVLLRAFATAAYSVQSLLIPLYMFFVCVLVLVLGKLAAGVAKISSPFAPYLSTGFEAGMLGYTLYEMLYGAENVAEFAIADLGQVLFVFTLYKMLLGNMGRGGEKKSAGALLMDMVRSPIIIAIAVGILLGATGLYHKMETAGISGVFDAAVGFLAAPTSVLILLVVGYDLSLKGVEWRAVGKMILLRLVLMLAMLFGTLLLLGSLMDLSPAMKGAFCLMFLLPPPFVLPAFADDPAERGNVASVLSIYTLVSIAAFVALTFLPL